MFSFSSVQFSSVTQSCPTLCDPMNRSTPGHPVHHQLPEFTHSCPLSQWCHPAISSSVVPFSSCPQSLLASGSFPMSQLFSWGGQSTGFSASASVLPVNTQDWAPLAPVLIYKYMHIWREGALSCLLKHKQTVYQSEFSIISPGPKYCMLHPTRYMKIQLNSALSSTLFWRLSRISQLYPFNSKWCF